MMPGGLHGQLALNLVKDHIYPSDFKLFQRVQLFYQFGDSAIAQLLVTMDTRRFSGPCEKYPQGQTIVERNEYHRELCVIVSGYCFAQEQANTPDDPIKLLGPGDVFGELSALGMGRGSNGALASTTVRARGASEQYINEEDNISFDPGLQADRNQAAAGATNTTVRVLSLAALQHLFEEHGELRAQMIKNIELKLHKEKRYDRRKTIEKRSMDQKVADLEKKIDSLDLKVDGLETKMGTKLDDIQRILQGVELAR